MFWLIYECFSILCNAFLLKSTISSHNSCDVGPGCVQPGLCLQFTHNPVFPKNKVLNNHCLLDSTPNKLKDELTGLHKTLQVFIFYC